MTPKEASKEAKKINIELRFKGWPELKDTSKTVREVSHLAPILGVLKDNYPFSEEKWEAEKGFFVSR